MTLRILHPAQQGARITWLDTLFARCGNDVKRIEVVESLPIPDVRESTWDEWDDAVLHQDRRQIGGAE